MTVILGTPGAALTTSDIEAGLQKVGIEGETKGAAALEKALGSSSKAVLAHSLRIPGKRGDIDHLILVGDRAIIVDSKLWSGSRFQIESSTATSIELTRDNEVFAGGTINLPRQMSQWATYLGLPRENVSAILLIPRHRVSFSSDREAGVTFASLDSLKSILTGMLGAAIDISPSDETVQLAQNAVQFAPSQTPEVKAGLVPLLLGTVSAALAVFVPLVIVKVGAALLAVLLLLKAWDSCRQAAATQFAATKRLGMFFKVHVVTAAVSVAAVAAALLL